MTQISKCCCLLLVAMLTLTTTAFSQRTDDEPVVVYDPDEIDGDRKFNINKLVIGGNGNFWIANAVFFEFSPFAAYRVTDRWLAGGGINYSYIMANDVAVPFLYTDEYGNEFADVIPFDTYTENFIGGRLLTRYLLFHIGDPQGIFATAEFQYNKKNIRVDSERIAKDRIYSYETNGTQFPVELQVNNSNVPSMLAGFGYTTNFYGQFGATFELMYDFLWEQDKSFTEYPFTYRVGFTYGF